MNHSSEDIIVANKYRITNMLGRGSFGVLFVGKNIKTNEEVAIKMEPLSNPHPSLAYEAKII